MRSVGKKTLSFILSIMIVFGLVRTGVGRLEPKAASYNVGDIIEYGRYPQSRVTSSSVLSKLNRLNLSWISYGYFSGTGSSGEVNYDGNMAAKNYMKYADVELSGIKYRAVKFTEYRPTSTGEMPTSEGSYQYYNGYYANTVYWFKYEPIKWRILDPANGLVMSEILLDAQPFMNMAYGDYDEYGYYERVYGNRELTLYASNYANSSIRSWLNGTFYSIAFSKSQRSAIELKTINNSSPYLSKYDSESTKDRIFLLSYNEIKNESYGLSPNYNYNSEYDSKLSTNGSAYAKCQGLREWNNISGWLLRSAADDGFVCSVDGFAYPSEYQDQIVKTTVDPTSYVDGIRPAMKLNLSKMYEYNFGDDTYSFENFVYEWGDYTKYGCNPLHDGHCFGMAVTSSGYYLDILSKGANEDMPLYDFPDNNTVRSPICFYQTRQGHALWMSIVAGDRDDKFYNAVSFNSFLDIDADWNEVVNYVKNHKHDNKGDLVILIYCPDKKNGGRHAVNFLYYKEVDGQKRIYAYDNNYPGSETYFYKASDGKVYQELSNLYHVTKLIDGKVYYSHGTFKDDYGKSLPIDSIGFMDVNKFFDHVTDLNTSDIIFAAKGMVTIEDATEYPMHTSSNGLYVSFEIPSDKTQVTITPLVDNAEFTYMDKTYSFGEINEDTSATLILSTSEESNDAEFSINNTDNLTFWDFLLAPFRVLAILFAPILAIFLGFFGAI